MTSSFSDAARALSDIYDIAADPLPIERLNTYSLAAVAPRLVTWLWPGRLPVGKLCILAGDPGLGKSFMTLDIAARVSLGGPWPDADYLPDNQTHAPQGTVLISTVEDGIADTVRPRLDELGANIDAIRIIDPNVQAEDDGKYASFSLSEHLALLEREILESHARLLILDPLLAYMGTRSDTHRASDVRAVLGPLSVMADQTQCVILGIMHLNKKSGETNSVYRITASGDFVNASRSAHIVGKHPDKDGVRVLAPVKTNLSADPPSIEYGFTQDGHFAWGPITELAATDVIQTQSPQEVKALDVAKNFVLNLLEDGPVLSADIYEAAQENDIALKTLQRARHELGVQVYQAQGKTGRRGSPGWWWSMLPPE